MKIRENRLMPLLYESLASVVIALFIWGIGVLGLGLVSLEENVLIASGVSRIYLLFATPVFLGIMSYFLMKWSHGYKGPSELITLLNQKSSEFPGWIRATVTWIIACIELGSGLSPKGFEGPYVATAGGLSGWFATKLKLDANTRRRLARCGLGIAFGVLFRSPLAGFVCTFEFGGFDKSEFRKQLLPAMISSLISLFLTTTTKLPTPFKILWLPSTITIYDMLLLVIVGLSCGVTALSYVFAIRIAKKIFGSMEKHTPLVFLPVVGAIVSTILGSMFPIILGSNELTRALSESPSVPIVLFGAIIAKILATASADGSKMAGGTVGPAILLGGMVGKLIGGLNPIFAIAGSAALIGPIAGLPFTMLLTGITWLGFPSSGWVIILPIFLAKAVCWRVELYPNLSSS